jgi:hypothetical protein
MTTRRWMIAVAILATALGGYLNVVRLIRQRDESLRTARSHAAAATRSRSLAARSEASAARIRKRARDAEPARQDDRIFRWTIDRMLGRASAEPAFPEESQAFAESQAIARAMAARSRAIQANHLLRDADHHRRMADYHAALERKYAAAAARPWAPIPPDPPEPR